MKFNELPTAAKIPLEPGTDSLEVHAPLNVVVLEPTGADSVDPQDETATVLAAAAESLQAVRSGQSRVEATSSPLRIHHRSQLVNEYEGFKHLMEGMFPTPFLFGCPYEKIPTKQQMASLINQADGRTGNNIELVLYLFNLRARVEASRSVAAKWRSNPHSIDAFHRLVQDPDFPSRLEELHENHRPIRHKCFVWCYLSSPRQANECSLVALVSIRVPMLRFATFTHFLDLVVRL